jgi:hypothetical protein
MIRDLLEGEKLREGQCEATDRARAKPGWAFEGDT